MVVLLQDHQALPALLGLLAPLGRLVPLVLRVQQEEQQLTALLVPPSLLVRVLLVQMVQHRLPVQVDPMRQA